MNLNGNRDPHFYAVTSEIRQAHFRASKLKIPVTFREQESFKSLKLALKKHVVDLENTVNFPLIN
jgi:hypothetical protein